ncbi:MAG: hypothetical protein AB1700_19765 [Bacillota bacterium]
MVRRENLRFWPVAARLWKEQVPGGFMRFRRVAKSAKAIELAAELRVQAEQALFLLVHDQRVSAERAHGWLAEILAEGAPRAQIRRTVFGVGFCVRQAPVEFGSFPIDRTEDPKSAPPETWQLCSVCGDPRCGEREATSSRGRVLTHAQVQREVSRGRLLPLQDAHEEIVRYVSAKDVAYLVAHGLKAIYSPSGRLVGLKKEGVAATQTVLDFE